ncbi:MAG: hypothetical protein K0S65_5764, partial [Labilithrix sp.]|nr:hypothetical protein [Labilithrix sp.]
NTLCCPPFGGRRAHLSKNCLEPTLTPLACRGTRSSLEARCVSNDGAGCFVRQADPERQEVFFTPSSIGQLPGFEPCPEDLWVTVMGLAPDANCIGP